MADHQNQQWARDVAHGEHHQIGIIAAASQRQFDGHGARRNRLTQFIPTLNQAELEQLPDDAVETGHQLEIDAHRHRHREAVNIIFARETKYLIFVHNRAVLGM